MAQNGFYGKNNVCMYRVDTLELVIGSRYVKNYLMSIEIREKHPEIQNFVILWDSR